MRHLLAALTLVIAATAVAPITTGNQAAATCGVFNSAEKRVDQKLVDLAWSVHMTAAVKYDTCGHVKLAWKKCSASWFFGWSVEVPWCGAYYPNGSNSSTKIDVGFNAIVHAPGRTVDYWSRRWAYGNKTFGAQRWGCESIC